MNLLNKIVVHKLFGEGQVTAQEGNYFIVKFSNKESKFVYPTAFGSFLKCKDETLQLELEKKVKENEEQKKQEAIIQQEAALRAIETAKKSPFEGRNSSSPTNRHSDENNLAFKCNYCDGGCSTNCLGYKGICSDKQIEENIVKKKRAWCSNQDSACFKYFNKMITRQELDASNQNGSFVCYESKMLIDWKAEAGDDLDEHGVHKARRIISAAKDSLAILTTESPKSKERIIFGAFITGIVDEGDDLYAGYVKAKEDFYIELTPQEAENMNFWHYYKNSNSTRKQWGSGLYRYLKDSVAARILADIVEIKTGDEKAHAQKVLHHYCSLKNIDIDNIPVANGLF